jgi:mevalonate kinase
MSVTPPARPAADAEAQKKAQEEKKPAKERTESFQISRVEMRRVMASFRVSERNIDYIISVMERAHRHMNVITFASMLENIGLSSSELKELLRRFGIEDIDINRIIEMVDEHKIMAESRKLFDVQVIFG